LPIGIAGLAFAKGANSLIVKAFTGWPFRMVRFGVLAGGLLAFCPFGVMSLPSITDACADQCAS